MIRVTYFIGNIGMAKLELHEDFERATAAFEMVKAIIYKEAAKFSDCDRTCDEYMNIVYSVSKGSKLKHENSIFSVEYKEAKE